MITAKRAGRGVDCVRANSVRSVAKNMARSRNLTSAFVRQDIEEYIYGLLPKRDAVLREIEAYAAKNRVPIIGPAVARLLALLVRISGAERIFEMGSAIGYSTICLARAAGPRGEVFYSDGDPENAQRARRSFQKAGVAHRIARSRQYPVARPRPAPSEGRRHARDSEIQPRRLRSSAAGHFHDFFARRRDDFAQALVPFQLVSAKSLA